jgi:uncharacterized Fe-S radical SAM superfamily protein PflX
VVDLTADTGIACGSKQVEGKLFPHLPNNYLTVDDSVWLQHHIVMIEKPQRAKSGKGYKLLATCSLCKRKCKISKMERNVTLQYLTDLNDHLGSALHMLEVTKYAFTHKLSYHYIFYISVFVD